MMTQAQKTNTQKRVRLVSTFGLGSGNPPQYKEIAYCWGGQEAQASTHIQKALAELFNVTSIGGVTTPQVVESWVQYAPPHNEPELASHAGDRLGREGLWSTKSKPEDLPTTLPFPLVHLHVIEKEPKEALYETFNAYLKLLSHEALAELGEREPPDEIIFDVTHGYRTQPILGLAAVLFTLQEWSRLELSHQQMPTLRVMYGAFEDQSLTGEKGKGYKPIWDITPFLTLQQLNNGLTSMVNYGRSELLEEVIRDAGDEAPEWLKELREVTHEVSADLNMIRSKDLAKKSAPKLKEVAERALEASRHDPHWVMLTESLKALKGWADHLTLSSDEPSIESEAGLELFKRLARRYRYLKHYPALLAVIAEGTITHKKLSDELTSRPSQPNQALGPLRNSVMHAQLDSDPPSHEELSESFEGLLEEFEELKLQRKAAPQLAQQAAYLILVFSNDDFSSVEYDRLSEVGVIHSLNARRQKSLRESLVKVAEGEAFPMLFQKLERHGMNATWVMSPQVAAHPLVNATLATFASQLKRPLMWCSFNGSGELSLRTMSFQPAMWLSDQ